MRSLLKSGGIALVLSLSSFGARAACQFADGVSSELNGYIHFGNIVVQRDAPVGSVLATATTGPYNGSRRVAGCTENWVFRWEPTQWKTLHPQGNNVYETNIPGVGIRITYKNWFVPRDFDLPASYVVIDGEGIKATLFKMGPISGGTLTPGVLARASVRNQFYIANATLGGNNTITTTACNITTPNVDVDMGRYDKSLFNGQGSTSEWRFFSIGLNCDKDARINVRFDATKDPSNIAGVMKLDNTDDAVTAAGIGVQLYFEPNNSPALLGQEQFYYTSLYGGAEVVKLKARYYQTEPSIKAGLANATATFTLTYK